MRLWLLSAITASSLVCAGTMPLAAASSHKLSIRGDRIWLDGVQGEVLYRSSGDLDGDGRCETALSVWMDYDRFRGMLIARQTCHGWQWLAQDDGYQYDLRTDVTDVNGDSRMEIIERAISGDGHGICSVVALRKGRVVSLGEFGQTRFRDLDGDGIPEVLSIGWISFGFVGDHWLTIYKWNGQGYTDVSARFPKQYDPVIKDIRREIYLLRYTSWHGHRFNPEHDPELFADMYYYLGRAYEYRGRRCQARQQYAIAYRLQPDDEEVAAAFREAWGLRNTPRQTNAND